MKLKNKMKNREKNKMQMNCKLFFFVLEQDYWNI